MKTIAVQLTGPGMGAIAVVAVAGDAAQSIVQRVAGPKKISEMQTGKSFRAMLLDPRTQTALDDSIIVCIAPHHYELHIHGGVAVVNALLEALEYAGAARTSIDEASRQNFFGPALHAEVTTTLPTAQTMTAARLIAAQAEEGLAAWASRWQDWLPQKSPEDLWRLHSATQWLLERSAALLKLRRPARLAIVGPPNAGKSTLANTLLGRSVAITSDTPGTTRDWVDALATFTHNDIHVPILLVDTAGIRDSQDELENASIARTHHQAALADIVLLLFDGSRRATPDELHLLDAFDPTRLLVASNKSDAGQIGSALLQSHHPTLLHISAKASERLDSLMSAVLTQLDLAAIQPTEPFAFTVRQHSILQSLSWTGDIANAEQLLRSLAS